MFVNGLNAGRIELADDFADHRGILSWHYQLRDKRLREAGSYGQLLRVALPREAVEKAADAGYIVKQETKLMIPAPFAPLKR